MSYVSMGIQELFSRKHFENKSPYNAMNISLGKDNQNHFLRDATLFPRPNHKLEVSTVPDMQYNLGLQCHNYNCNKIEIVDSVKSIGRDAVATLFGVYGNMFSIL